MRKRSRWFGSSTTPLVSAHGGAVAVGGDIQGSEIRLGLDEDGVGRKVREANEPILRELSKLAESIAKERGIPAAPLRAILTKIGERDFNDGEIPSKLNVAADQLIQLRKRLAQTDGNFAELGAIRAQALESIERGQFEAAQRALDGARNTARSLRLNAISAEVELLTDEAHLLHLQYSYSAAAKRFGEAAALVLPYNARRHFELLFEQASELVDEGVFGRNEALVDAIGILNGVLAFMPREGFESLRAESYYSLGSALGALGERELGAIRLHEAIATLRLAAGAAPRESLLWGRAHNLIGVNLWNLSRRSKEPSYIQKSADAIRLALTVLRRDRHPKDWASAQSNLGMVLRELGERSGSANLMSDALEAYRNALKVTRRKSHPLVWATIHHNIGVSLIDLGLQTGDVTQFDAAADALEKALKERTKERVPYLWATTKVALAGALFRLGENDDDPLTLKTAIGHCRDALDKLPRETVPWDWASAHQNIANSLLQLGQLKSDESSLREAIAEYELVLQERQLHLVPKEWAETMSGLAGARFILGNLDQNPAIMRAAVSGFREVLSANALSPLGTSMALRNLALVLCRWTAIDGDSSHASEAVQIVERLLDQPGPLQSQGGVDSLRPLLEEAKALLLKY